jgi:hypothetical protein
MNLANMLQEHINTTYNTDFVGVDKIAIIPTIEGFYEVWYHITGERGDRYNGVYASIERARYKASLL